MNILNVMKQKNLKPGVIIYTNLLQICFNMRKVDRAVILYERMQQEDVQSKKNTKNSKNLKYFLVDHVCFTKLVNGAMNCGKIELAYSFYEKSLTEKISLNVHIYEALVEELKASKIPEKAKMITNLEYSIANSGLYLENNNNNNNSRFLQEKTDFENKFKENRQISFEIKERDNEKSMKRDNFSKKPKVLGEHKNNYNNSRNQYNKENKDNFNFRNKEPLEPKEKTQDPPMFIGVGKKSNPPFISQKDLCSMVRVNPKNL